MTKEEALTIITTGNFSGDYRLDMQLLVDAVGIIGEMFKSGQINEVVRCKDCIHCEYALDDTWFCAKLDGIRVSADDFCSRGRRE